MAGFERMYVLLGFHIFQFTVRVNESYKHFISFKPYFVIDLLLYLPFLFGSGSGG